MNNKLCLIIIFNHRFDKNIDKLRKLYKDRFSNIRFLVPFYNGMDNDVIPVYGSSFQFQGYISQGFNQYYNDMFEHYLFIADDMIINPSINEDNYADFFKLDSTTGYITDLEPLSNWNCGVERIEDAIKAWNCNGVNYLSELPPVEDSFSQAASKGFDAFFYSKKRAFNKSLFSNKKYWFSSTSRIKLLLNVIKNKGIQLPFPFMSAYSDIFICSKVSAQ